MSHIFKCLFLIDVYVITFPVPPDRRAMLIVVMWMLLNVITDWIWQFSSYGKLFKSGSYVQEKFKTSKS